MTVIKVAMTFFHFYFYAIAFGIHSIYLYFIFFVDNFKNVTRR